MLNPRPVELDSPLNRRVRVFLGIGPAPAEWAEPLSLWVTQVARRVSNWKWVEPANLHLTLRFFGTVTQADVLKIGEIILPIARAISPFAMEPIDLALFPSPSQPQVAAIKVRDQSGELLALENKIRDHTATFGKAPERRDFTPHVTFGRVKNSNRRAEKVIGDLWMENAMPELPDWPVKEAKLFMSDLRPGGSVYTPLAKFPLASDIY